jgi:hypothetical protein
MLTSGYMKKPPPPYMKFWKKFSRKWKNSAKTHAVKIAIVTTMAR